MNIVIEKLDQMLLTENWCKFTDFCVFTENISNIDERLAMDLLYEDINPRNHIYYLGLCRNA